MFEGVRRGRSSVIGDEISRLCHVMNEWDVGYKNALDKAKLHSAISVFARRWHSHFEACYAADGRFSKWTEGCA